MSRADVREVLAEAIRRGFMARPNETSLDHSEEIYATAHEIADEILAQCDAMNVRLRLAVVPAAGVTEPDVPERPNQPTTTHRVASVPVQPPRRT